MGVDGWIKWNKARDGQRVCERKGRKTTRASFGSRSVLLPSSWTSLVAGVNYWDCTRTHADKCSHTRT